MYRLNIKVTEEAVEILKKEAQRINGSMGTVVTIWALEKKKETDALSAMALYKQEQERIDGSR